MQELEKTFFEKSWVKFDYDPQLVAWTEAARNAIEEGINAPHQEQWRRHQNTWFVGVNALRNNIDGAVDGGQPIGGKAIDFIRHNLHLNNFPWDQAQISVCYPGYPQPSSIESAAAHRYRVKRDAAHIDGIRRLGENNQRFLLEHHGFILGIPLVELTANNSPPVVWEASHERVRQSFQTLFTEIDPEGWKNINITAHYQSLRRQLFDQCPRITIFAKPGEAFLIHRLALHGIAPWSGGNDDTTPRTVCYFRPEIGGAAEWLEMP